MHGWKGDGEGGGMDQDIIVMACGYGTGTRGERIKLIKTVAEIERFSLRAGPALRQELAGGLRERIARVRCGAQSRARTGGGQSTGGVGLKWPSRAC